MYLDFIKKNFTPSEEEWKLLEDQETQDLYQVIQQNGGFINSFTEECNRFEFEQNRNKLPLFQKYLLNFELNTTTLDGTYLERSHYIDQSLVLDHMIEPPETWLTEQITVWSFPIDIVNRLNSKHFTFDDLSKRHGNQMIDIRVQDPKVDTFKPSNDQNSQANRMKIEDYCNYLRNKDEFLLKHPEYPADKVLFAVNVDMDNWDEETAQLYEYMPQSLLKYDGLVYMRQFCLGVNVPQMYIKTEGVWTGGHQENSAVNSINFNHGPNSCIWYTIDAKHVHKLLDLVPDLYKIEGLWFKNINFFLENKIPIKQTIQNKGDLIILGAGCLHWVKSLGNTINTSWNTVISSDNTFQQIIERQKINDQYGITNVIPIKNLLLDIYIHKGFKSLKSCLNEYLSQEIDVYNDSFTKYEECRKQFISREVLLCSKCKMEIFVFFQQLKENEFRCIKCIEGEGITVYMKYNPAELFLAFKANTICCSHSLCSNYMGQTDCQLEKAQEEKSESKTDTYTESIVSEEIQVKAKRHYKKQKENKVIDDEDLFYGSDAQLVCNRSGQRHLRKNKTKKEKVQEELISEICTSQKHLKIYQSKQLRKHILRTQRKDSIEDDSSFEISSQSEVREPQPILRKDASFYQC